MKYPEGAIQTFTGKFIKPLDPHPDDIDIRDIAHALSNMCRYAGHVNKFLSVAEHSVLACIYTIMQDFDYGLEALLHDATEAYLVDVPKPYKHLLPDYCKYEAQLQEVIDFKFKLKPHTKLLKEIDTRLLVSESSLLFNPGITVEGVEPYPKFHLENFHPEEAEDNFLAWFEHLTINRSI
jgi:uncharacterized protein